MILFKNLILRYVSGVKPTFTNVHLFKLTFMQFTEFIEEVKKITKLISMKQNENEMKQNENESIIL